MKTYEYAYEMITQKTNVMDYDYFSM